MLKENFDEMHDGYYLAYILYAFGMSNTLGCIALVALTLKKYGFVIYNTNCDIFFLFSG